MILLLPPPLFPPFSCVQYLELEALRFNDDRLYETSLDREPRNAKRPTNTFGRRLVVSHSLVDVRLRAGWVLFLLRAFAVARSV